MINIEYIAKEIASELFRDALGEFLVAQEEAERRIITALSKRSFTLDDLFIYECKQCQKIVKANRAEGWINFGNDYFCSEACYEDGSGGGDDE